MEKTSLGLKENVEGALCYLLWWLTGIIFYILEKDNKFVRFHARQSIVVFLPIQILLIILGGFFFWSWYTWVFLWWIRGLIWLIGIILWIILMIKAYQGEMFKLPIVGDIAEKGF